MIPQDPQLIWIIVTSFIAAFMVAFGIGANDVANSFGTSVGSRVLTIGQACILASIFELSGAILLGSHVTEAIRNLSAFENAPKDLLIGSFVALIATFILLIIANFANLPVSASHSMVGAVVGFALVHNSTSGIDWKKFAIIFGSWLLAPIISGLISCLIYYPVKRLILEDGDKKTRGFFILPGFYALVISINLLSVLFYGPPYIIGLSLWVRGTIFGVTPILVIIIVRFFVTPKISKRIDKAYEDLVKEEHLYDINGLEIRMPHCFNRCGKDDQIDKRQNEKGRSNLGFVNDSNSELGEKHEFVLQRVINSPIVRYHNESIRIQRGVEVIVKNDPPEIFHSFAFLQTLTAIFTSFTHGGNDVSNSIGPLVSIWTIWTKGEVKQKIETPIWILGFGGIGISLGLWLLGWKVMRTIRKNLTKITPSVGFAIEFSAAFTVLLASKLGLPVSTTHCQVGGIVFTGILQNMKFVNCKLCARIGFAWLVTVPISTGLSAGMFWSIKRFMNM